MTKTESFTNEEVRNLLKNIKITNENKQKYKWLLELENKVREIVMKRKMSKTSRDIILDILSGLRITIAMHTLPLEEKVNINMDTAGFKSNTDFNYYRWLDQLEEITEPTLKKEVMKIILNLKKPLNDAEKEFRRMQNENTHYGCKLICPCCENEYMKDFGINARNVKDEFIEKCPNCSKEYKVLAGKVILWRSRGTGVVRFGRPEYTVRIKNKNGERVLIFNSNYNLLHIKIGDGIYLIFKKKKLGSQFSETPFAVINATSNTHSLI